MKKPRPRTASLPEDAVVSELQHRAAAFLARPIPVELQPHYVADSIAERIITACAQGEALDPDLRELAEIAAPEYDELAAQARTDELRAYYAESHALLAAILRAG